MAKTIAEINEKIKKKKAVVVTADEIIDLVEEEGIKKATQKVDVLPLLPLGLCAHQVPTLTLVIPDPG